LILRKPYALLIKYFRIIHVILSLFGAYIFYSLNNIYPYLSSYINNPSTLKGFDVSKTLFPGLLYFAVILLLVSSFVLLALMVFKKKPYLYYLISTASYIYLFVVINMANGYINTMENSLLDILKIRVAADLVTIALFLQAINFGYAFLRATGFSLKKFDFGQDLDALEISEDDREEFEVQVEFDFNIYATRARRFMRNLKYYYVENKFYSNIIILATIVTITIMSLTNIFILNKTYNENNFISTTDYKLKVLESYTTTRDYKNTTILTDTKLVVVKIDIQSFKEGKYLNKDAYYLLVNNKRYNAVGGYTEAISDLGNTYKNNLLTTTLTPYLLVFEVPTTTNLAKSKILFTNYVFSGTNLLAEAIQIRLKVKVLDNDLITKTYQLKDIVNLKDTILASGTLAINSVTIDDMVTLTYNFCANTTYCFDSVEILRPILDSYEKQIMSIEGSISNMTMNRFMARYGTLEYASSTTNNFNFLEPKNVKITTTNYYEIKKSLLEPTKLVFNIRNYRLEYIITTNNL